MQPNLLGRVARSIFDALGFPALWIPGRVGSDLRVAYYRMRGATIGQQVRIEVGVMLDRPDSIRIGSRCWIDRYVILIAGGPRPIRETRLVGDRKAIAAGTVSIGDRCHIGPHSIVSGIGGVSIGDDVTLSAGCKVYSLSHHYRSWAEPNDSAYVYGSQADPSRQSMIQGPIEISSNVGLGVDVLVLPGAQIGRDSFVRPRTTVAGAWPENSLLSGDPVRREGDRFSLRAG